MIKCEICSREMKSARSLSKHIRDAHKTGSEAYWNLANSRPLCPCGKETKFKNIRLGYEAYCGHSCSAKAHRAALREDAEKFEAFRRKVSHNMESEWACRSDVEKREIFSAAASSNRRRITRMTDEERRTKYNHNESGNYQSLKDFWETVSDEERGRIYALIHRNASATSASMTPNDYTARVMAKVAAWEEAGGFSHIDNALGA